MLVVYIGSLAALLITSLYTTDPFTTRREDVSLDNFRDIWENDVYRTVTFRTIGVAAAVTIIDAVIAIPAAFFMAKIVRAVVPPDARCRRVAAAVGELLGEGIRMAGDPRPGGRRARGVVRPSPGFGLTGTIIVLAYLWLPYMVLPIYAGLERLPDSLLEASGDLGAKGFRTFRSVVFPVMSPAVVAGSIFTFSLSLGDYIAVNIVGGTTQMLGNTYPQFFGVPNLPFAAALAMIPVVAHDLLPARASPHRRARQPLSHVRLAPHPFRSRHCDRTHVRVPLLAVVHHRGAVVQQVGIVRVAADRLHARLVGDGVPRVRARATHCGPRCGSRLSQHSSH